MELIILIVVAGVILYFVFNYLDRLATEDGNDAWRAGWREGWKKGYKDALLNAERVVERPEWKTSVAEAAEKASGEILDAIFSEAEGLLAEMPKATKRQYLDALGKRLREQK